MDYNLPGSFSHGILQARILEWVDISFPNSLESTGKVIKEELRGRKLIMKLQLASSLHVAIIPSLVYIFISD